MSDPQPRQHIEVVDGRAVIAGTTVKAIFVANLYMNGATINEVIEQYGITEADVYAAATYFADHRAYIEQKFSTAETHARETGLSAEQFKATLRKENAG